MSDTFGSTAFQMS